MWFSFEWTGGFLFHRKYVLWNQKCSARMHTRAKQKHVASDRARRPDVPGHILFHCCKTHVWIWVFREADGYAIIEALSEFLTGFSCVRSESFCAWFCEMFFCQLCPNFWGVRGAYVDEIRVRLAENQPQKQVQKDSKSTFLYNFASIVPRSYFMVLSLNPQISKKPSAILLL